MRWTRAALLVLATMLASLLGPLALTTTSVAAAGAGDIPSSVPAANTPWVNNGQVLAITQVDDTMVLGGTFTTVSPSGGGATLTRSYIAAFDAGTGQISTGFAPVVNGVVETLEPGPGGTVYVGGKFTKINGKGASRVAQLDLGTGQAVAAFKAPTMNGAVEQVKVSRGRLYVGGAFTTIGGVAHMGLGTLNATTGALDPFMNVQLTERHNDSGSGAEGAVGARALDVSADGSRMIVVGNFRKADGVLHEQVVMINVDGASASVQPDWATTRYEPACFSNAFDTYTRSVAFAPSGDWFVITATGGHNVGTLCDTASRFETKAVGTALQPTWISDTGGDTLWGLAISDKAVYVGGHQRWMNNPDGGDFAGQGAVARPGLAALDPSNGLPLAWNPGRNPRGAGSYAIYVGTGGVWVGSDTEWIGNREYRRERIAFFPQAGGYTLPSTSTGTLPADVYLAGRSSAGASNVLFRVNAGGQALQSLDGGPDWSADQGPTSPYRNSGSNAAPWPDPVPLIDTTTVPASTPNAVFDSERWDPQDATEMAWHFPVPAGQQLSVRLYFANRCSCTSAVGQRRFNVGIDGVQKLAGLDIVAQVGDQKGTMRSFPIASDGTVDISFAHVVENPLVNGIEIVRTDVAPPPPSGVDQVTTIAFDGTTAAPAQAYDNGGVAWGTSRGGFMLGSTLYYGQADGLYKRSFNGAVFGAASKLDPYHSPVWDGVATGSGTSTYTGATVAFYSELPNVTGLFYADGRIYYSLLGQTSLFYRYFSADSGIVGATRFTAGGGLSWSDAGGMFVDSGTLYFVQRSSGALWKVAFAAGSTSGPAVKVDDPAAGGQSWNARTLFIGPAAPPNQAPVANIGVSCPNLTCTFSGAGSTDADGTIASYSWDLGGGVTASGASVQHTYPAPGTYTAVLTVTDNDGATGQATRSVTVSDPATSPIAHVAAAGATSGSSTAKVTIPAQVQPGNVLLLSLDYSSATVTAGDATGVTGWTALDTADADGLRSALWWKLAAASDAGAVVTLPLSGATKSTLQVAAYSGTSATSPVAGFAKATDTAASSAHVAPAVATTSGSWVVSMWADKSTSTTSWTTPAGVTVRDARYGSGTAFVSSVLADSGAVGLGTYPAQTASVNGSSSRGAMWSVVLAE